MNNLIKNIATLLKIFLGAFFVFSALSKFVDIDRLNVYIYSFGMLPFNLSVVASWMLISLELVLGVLLLTNRWHRITCLGNVLLLAAFSLFLCYAQLSGRTDNCHCLGEMLPFSPVQSLLKNAVLLVLVLFVWKYADSERHIHVAIPIAAMLLCAGVIFFAGRYGWLAMTYLDFQYCLTLAGVTLVPAVLFSTRFWNRWWSIVVLAGAPVVAIFILSVAANWIHSETEAMVDQPRFSQAVSPDGPLAAAAIPEGRKIVCIYSRTCSYCRMASQKVSMIQQRNGLDASSFVTIFPGDDTVGISAFYEAGVNRYAEFLLPDTTTFYITRAQVPLVMLVDEGRVVEAFSHSDISESAIVDFLKQ